MERPKGLSALGPWAPAQGCRSSALLQTHVEVEFGDARFNAEAFHRADGVAGRGTFRCAAGDAGEDAVWVTPGLAVARNLILRLAARGLDHLDIVADLVGNLFEHGAKVIALGLKGVRLEVLQRLQQV